MATLKDVAERAGVSEATVSMVLNGRPGPKAATRQRVADAVRELRYVPNSHARNLALKENAVVGFVVTDIENPFFGSLTRHVSHYLGLRDQTMILSISEDDEAREDAALQAFVQQGVGGIIVAPTQLSARNTAILDDIAERGIPIVFVSSYYSNFTVPRVLTDYERGSRELVRYLIETGHRDIRFLVSADVKAPIAHERIKGFFGAYEDARLRPSQDSIHTCPHPDYDSALRETEALLSATRPDALIAINDVMALAAHRAARKCGFKVPGDISIAGYDDVLFASIAEIPLTTVRQNIQEIARVAVDLLFLKDQRSRLDTRIRPELVVRESTARRSVR